MTNNKAQGDFPDKDVEQVVRAQLRVLRVYEKCGTWRAVAVKLGLSNVHYAYAFALRGEIPANPEIRRRLFLPRRFGHVRRHPVWSEYPEWMKWWRGLDKARRHEIIRNSYEDSQRREQDDEQ